MVSNGFHEEDRSQSISKADMDAVFQDMLVRLFREEEGPAVDRMISHVRDCRAMVWSSPNAAAIAPSHGAVDGNEVYANGASNPRGRSSDHLPRVSTASADMNGDEVTIAVSHTNLDNHKYLVEYLDIGSLFAQIALQCVLHRPQDPLHFVVDKLNIAKSQFAQDMQQAMQAPHGQAPHGQAPPASSSNPPVLKSSPHSMSREDQQYDDWLMNKIQEQSGRKSSYQLRRGSVSAECIGDDYNIKVKSGGKQDSGTMSIVSRSGSGGPLPVIPKSSAQREVVKAALRGNILFNGLDEQTLNLVVDAVGRQELTRGTVVIRQGEPGDMYYIVDSGQVEVTVANDPTASPVAVLTCGPMEGFGELALMYNAPRAATVTVISENTALWTLDRNTFRTALGILSSGNQPGGGGSRKTSNARTSSDSGSPRHGVSRLSRPPATAVSLEGLRMMSSIPQDTRVDLEGRARVQQFGAGDVIMKQGDIGHHFFVLLEGQATASVLKGEYWVPVRGYGRGDVFGELALMTGNSRTATIQANTQCTCAVVDTSAFAECVAPFVDFRQLFESYQQGTF